MTIIEAGRYYYVQEKYLSDSGLPYDEYFEVLGKGHDTPLEALQEAKSEGDFPVAAVVRIEWDWRKANEALDSLFVKERASRGGD
ncbi:MAG: hypothetical protein NWE79_00770 [Candidatus Bathyarchaeota archaeon]|nr:hypothetical protein [Candidatus Bathyarchaeota archaeon]